MRKLSKAIKNNKTYLSYAHCSICKENFVDDLPYHVLCPNGCPTMLDKGFEIHHSQKDLPEGISKLVDDNFKELL